MLVKRGLEAYPALFYDLSFCSTENVNKSGECHGSGDSAYRLVAIIFIAFDTYSTRASVLFNVKIRRLTLSAQHPRPERRRRACHLQPNATLWRIHNFCGYVYGYLPEKTAKAPVHAVSTGCLSNGHVDVAGLCCLRFYTQYSLYRTALALEIYSSSSSFTGTIDACFISCGSFLFSVFISRLIYVKTPIFPLKYDLSISIFK